MTIAFQNDLNAAMSFSEKQDIFTSIESVQYQFTVPTLWDISFLLSFRVPK